MMLVVVIINQCLQACMEDLEEQLLEVKPGEVQVSLGVGCCASIIDVSRLACGKYNAVHLLEQLLEVKPEEVQVRLGD